MESLRHNDATSQLALAALGFSALIAAVSTAVPQLDLAAAKLFYGRDGIFIGEQVALFRWLRQAFVMVFIGCCFAAGLGLIITRTRARTWLGLIFTQWLFLAICMGMGPGVVSNLAFKDHWGRARPHQIAEFGGTKVFTPALVPADQCVRNCSFVSGEASSMFLLFFAAAFMFRKKAAVLISCGVFAGAIAGLVRMAQGAHFLTDVAFAGVLMAFTAASVNYVFEAVAAAGRNSDEPAVSPSLA